MTTSRLCLQPCWVRVGRKHTTGDWPRCCARCQSRHDPSPHVPGLGPAVKQNDSRSLPHRDVVQTNIADIGVGMLERFEHSHPLALQIGLAICGLVTNNGKLDRQDVVRNSLNGKSPTCRKIYHEPVVFWLLFHNGFLPQLHWLRFKFPNQCLSFHLAIPRPRQFVLNFGKGFSLFWQIQRARKLLHSPSD